VTRGLVTAAALAVATALVLAPTAAASGPPIDIEPAGSVPTLPTPRGTAASADTAVKRALQRGGVDAATVAADVRLLRKARRLSRRTRGAGGRELAAVVASTVRIARTSGFTTQRAKAVFLELSVNAAQLPKRVPKVHARLRISSLTFERYPGQGLRIQPLASWWFARDTARHGDVRVTKRLLDTLLALSIPHAGGALTTEYYFPFGGGAPPWSSPMAHGLALDALRRGFVLTGDDRYRVAALNFAKSVAASDVAPGSQVWFPIYPFSPGLRVLNADLQVILGLDQLLKLPGGEVYTNLADRAATTAEQRLPRYDTGSWSRYSESREAPLEYHDLMTQQLRQLGKERKDPVFTDYATTFADYRVEPPAFDVLPGGAKLAYPLPRDGFRDGFTVRFTVTKLSRVVVTWRRNGKRVQSKPLGLLSGGRHTVRWSPGKARAGFYTIGFAGKDVAGNFGDVTDDRPYEIARDRTPPAIVSVRYAGGKLRWKLKDGGTPWVSVAIKVGRKTRTLKKRPLAGSVTLTKAPSLVTFRDSTGNRVRWRRITLPH
jgi:hypothetical protein